MASLKERASGETIEHTGGFREIQRVLIRSLRTGPVGCMCRNGFSSKFGRTRVMRHATSAERAKNVALCRKRRIDIYECVVTLCYAVICEVFAWVKAGDEGCDGRGLNARRVSRGLFSVLESGERATSCDALLHMRLIPIKLEYLSSRCFGRAG